MTKLLAVQFQDGGLMTFNTDFTRRAQFAEAKDVLEGANEGIRKGGKLAMLVEIEIASITEVTTGKRK
jgi:hypothetical protein